MGFVALSIATEMIEALRYKLMSFGVPAIGSAEVFCDNKSVVKKLIIPTSVLNKKHITICYHSVREYWAASVLCDVCIPGGFYMSDLFTKTTIPGNTRHNLVDSIFLNTASPIGGIKKL